MYDRCKYVPGLLFNIMKLCCTLLKDKDVMNKSDLDHNKQVHHLSSHDCAQNNCVRCTTFNKISFKSNYKPFIQVFNFEHGILFGEMNCLQVSAMYSVVMPLLELSFRGPASTPVLQVTQGSRY